jgi:hypothetical protein
MQCTILIDPAFSLGLLQWICYQKAEANHQLVCCFFIKKLATFMFDDPLYRYSKDFTKIFLYERKYLVFNKNL